MTLTLKKHANQGTSEIAQSERSKYRGFEWNRGEANAWQAPPAQTVAEWAEDNRELDSLQTSNSGPLRNEVAIYLVPIMNLCNRPGVSQLTIKKATQVGASEAVRSAIGYKAHIDPDPMLLVLPDEKKGRAIVRKRILPLFKTTPCLNALLGDRSSDTGIQGIVLKNGFDLTLGWSGSASSLASDPKRTVINDEVDKFQPWTGKEADPISLGKQRTKTYEDLALIINISTPTTEDGMITTAFNNSRIKLFHWWTCPGCDHHFLPTLSILNYEIDKSIDPNDKAARSESIIENQSAWLNCPACDKKIRERDKAKIVRESFYAERVGKGKTQAGGWRLFCDGSESGEMPPGQSVGIHLPCFPCSWIKFWDIAAEFVISKGSLSMMMNVYNSWLGEEFKLKIASPTIKIIEKKIQKFVPPGVLPMWTGKLLACADLQKDHAWYEIRAYGHDFRSIRIDHGKIGPFKGEEAGIDFLQELYSRTIGTIFPFEDRKWSGLRPQFLAIDTGGTSIEVDDDDEEASMTTRAYKFALADPERIIACKSESKATNNPLHYRVSDLIKGKKRKTKAAEYGVKLHLIDPNWFKDLLMSQINSSIEITDKETGEVKKVPRWALNSLRDRAYERQMVSEHKIINRDRKKVWTTIQPGTANHYWDVGMMMTFLAHLAGVESLPTSERIAQIRNSANARVQEQERMKTPDGREYHITDRKN